MSIFDIDVQKLASSGIVHQVRNPLDAQPAFDDFGNPYTITVLGVDCQEWQNGVKAVQRELGKESFTMQEMIQYLPEVLSKNVIGWSNNTELEGEKLTFSEANALKLFKSRRWVPEQLYGTALSKEELRKKHTGA